MMQSFYPLKFPRSAWFLFFVFSLFFLYLPDYSGGIYFYLFLVGCVCFICLGSTSTNKILESGNQLLILCLFFFAGWIVISFLLHFAALKSLEPLSYITVKKHTAAWGIRTLEQTAQLYLFFPFLLLISLIFFQGSQNRSHYLWWLPVFFIPSLLFGLYQGIYLGLGSRISGFSFDQSAFGMLLFLLFPVMMMGLLSARRYWLKAIFFVLIGLLLWCLVLRSQRTALLGILLFLGLLPGLLIRVRSFVSFKQQFRVLAIVYGALLILLVALSLAVISAPKWDSPLLVQNLHRHYHSYKDAGITGFWESIKRGRTHLGGLGIAATIDAPLGGWGPGGFYRQINNLQFERGEKLRSVHNTANQYLQMSAELGIPGFLMNTFLHLFPLWMVFRIRQRPAMEYRLTTVVAWVTAAIMMLLYMTGPHTLAPDVNWVLTALLGYLAGTAVKFGYVPGKWCSRTIIFACLVLTPLFIYGTYQTSFGEKGYKALQQRDDLSIPRGYGYYYPYENWDGRKMIWTAKNALAVHQAASNILGIEMFVPHHTANAAEGVKVVLCANDKIIDDLHFFQGGYYHWYYYIPTERKSSIALHTQVSQTFNPKDLGLSKDGRDLGIALGPVQFLNLMPGKGLGFYEMEIYGGVLPQNWEEDKKLKFRWTRKQASIPLRNISVNDGVSFFVMAAHPDLSSRPVEVSIKADNRNIQTIRLSDGHWQKVFLSTEKLSGQSILSFEVDRTWNPKKEGMSGDGRDLGIAVSEFCF
jgi:hypothetical protein